jgi:hypothetical protein
LSFSQSLIIQWGSIGLAWGHPGHELPSSADIGLRSTVSRAQEIARGREQRPETLDPSRREPRWLTKELKSAAGI